MKIFIGNAHGLNNIENLKLRISKSFARLANLGSFFKV